MDKTRIKIAPAAQEPALWAHVAVSAITWVTIVSLGLGFTLALMTAVLANQAALHRQFCYEIDYLTPLLDGIPGLSQYLAPPNLRQSSVVP
ncbi:hypothetical protein ABID21_005040 [Pseudorhizobium tarimense]|uniref:Uncharacterized protein n=1 Tax=Pseudorhizobium tarimense TaxID=1079109 RepID=A0ABV2HEC8_9HYPH